MSDLPEGHHRIKDEDMRNFTVDEEGNLYWKGKRLKSEGNNKPSSSPENDSLAQKVLEVGDRLNDGTVVVAVDPGNNTSLRVPQRIFGGKSDFDHQDGVVEKANAQSLHGHNDWRRITDDEGKTLSEVWDKVAPKELKGRAALWFWLASPNYGGSLGRVRRGGVADWGSYTLRGHSVPVPVVRSGPARS